MRLTLSIANNILQLAVCVLLRQMESEQVQDNGTSGMSDEPPSPKLTDEPQGNHSSTPPKPPPRLSSQLSGNRMSGEPSTPTNDENDEGDNGGAPPKPPPRLNSQMSTASKMIPLAATVDSKPTRPVWFRLAYVAVGLTITGILTAVLGCILVILRWIKFQTGTEGRYHYYFFGRRVPKSLGIYVFIFGLMVTFFGALFFHAALIRINTYIKELEAFNSKTGREHRERPRWEEADPLLEEDEDDYYEKKRKDM